MCPGSQGKGMRTEEWSSRPSSIRGWSSIRVGGPQHCLCEGGPGTRRGGSLGRVLTALPRTATHGRRGAPCGSPSQGLPGPLSALHAPHCPALPNPLPGGASALHVSLLSLTAFPLCSRCVLMWLSYPQPSQLSSLPDWETPSLLVSHETAFPGRFELPSPWVSALEGTCG